MTKEYYTGKLDDERYLKSNVWKCKKSPTGAHHWIGDTIELYCIYCNKKQHPEYRSTEQIHLDIVRAKRSAEASANKDRELQYI